MQNCLVFPLNCCHKWSVQEWQRTWPRASLHSNVRTSKYQTAHRYPCYVGPSPLPFILPIRIKLFLRSASILIRWAGKAGKDLPTDQRPSLAPHAFAIVILMHVKDVEYSDEKWNKSSRITQKSHTELEVWHTKQQILSSVILYLLWFENICLIGK